MKLKCSECQKEYEGYKHKRSKNNFCSKSCAAKFNNKKHPKRKLTKTCKTCSNKIPSSQTYCKDCIKIGRHLPDTSNRTIESVLNGRTDANRYTNIRKHASNLTKSRKQPCAICGYDKHVETCHIKSIKDFPKSSTIGEVNDPKNLILLCRNCHWEFDHNMLDIDIQDYIYSEKE